MKTTFSKSDLESPASRNAIVALIDGAKHGGFIVVHSLKTKTGYGETSDYTFCKGISYPNAVEKSLSMLADIEANPNFAIETKRGTWQNKSGEINPTNRKSKDFPLYVVAPVSVSFKKGSASLYKALESIKLSLITPKAPAKEYKALGNGIYEDDNGKLFIRDLRLVSKKVLVEGQYPQSASSEEVVIADYIKRSMPVGNYRQFNLDGDYTSITIDGTELVMEGEVEQVKQTANAETEKVEA